MKMLRTLLALTLISFLGAATQLDAAKEASSTHDTKLFIMMAATEQQKRDAILSSTDFLSMNLNDHASHSTKTFATMTKAYDYITAMVAKTVKTYNLHMLCKELHATYPSQGSISEHWTGFDKRATDFYKTIKIAISDACTTFLTRELIAAITNKVAENAIDTATFKIQQVVLNGYCTLFSQAITADSTIEIFMSGIVEILKDQKVAQTITAPKTSSHGLWWAAKSSVKLAALGFAFYGADVASGGMLSTLTASGLMILLNTLIAKTGIDVATLTTYLCNFGAVKTLYSFSTVAKWLPALCAA